MSSRATATGVGVGGVGTLVVSLLDDVFGVQLDPELAAGLVWAVTALAILIAHEGLRGLLRRLWRGQAPR